MRTALVRAALMCTSLTLRVLPGVPVNAELPSHHKVATLRRCRRGTAGELESGCPIFSGFGLLAILDGTAFVAVLVASSVFNKSGPNDQLHC
jgi:hypothetical protein